MHGDLFRSRCSVFELGPIADEEVYAPDVVPSCGRCKSRGATSLLRPDMVWFGETLDSADLARIDAFMARASRAGRWIFLAADTSGVVHPAAGLVDAANRRGAETWLVNAEAAENTARFGHFVRGRSGDGSADAVRLRGRVIRSVPG